MESKSGSGVGELLLMVFGAALIIWLLNGWLSKRQKRWVMGQIPRAIGGIGLAAVAIWLIDMIGTFIAQQPVTALLLAVALVAGIWRVSEYWQPRFLHRFLVILRGRHLERRYDLGQLLALTPMEFEEVTADLLRDLGYRYVKLVGGIGDGGIDIECRDEHNHLVIAQCKQYGRGNRISSPHIQSFIGAVARLEAEHGIFITTSNYTLPALDMARSYRVIPIDGEGLLGLMAVADGARKSKSPAKRLAEYRASFGK